MYDDEAEIKKKRRNLILGIAVVLGLILLLIIIMIVAGSSKNKNGAYKQPTCELTVLDEVKTNKDGAYMGAVTIGIDESKTTVSKGYTISSKKVGLTNSPRNAETYKLSKSGKTKVYGYVTDSKGGQGVCEKEFEIITSRPNCQLKVTDGKLGTDNWYVSDVVVGFESKTVENGTIESYSIEEKEVEPTISTNTTTTTNSTTSSNTTSNTTTNTTTSETTKADAAKNNDTYTVKADAELEVVGTVVDNYGISSNCSLIVKKDTEKPTCTLEVKSGTKGSDGKYTNEVVVGIAKSEDKVSGVLEQGVGVEENFKEETYKVTKSGKTVVKGYVKDKAGNVGECSLEIERTGGSSATSNPSCKLKVTSAKKDGNNHIDKVVVTFASKTTDNGAKITEYGISTSAQLNNTDSLILTDPGSYTVYGTVRDSNGRIAECKETLTLVSQASVKESTPSCSLYVDATKQTDGSYVKSVTVKFRTKQTTNNAKIVDFGIGQEYKLTGKDTYTVGPGTYKVYGMVKDSYGHTAKCGPLDFTVSSSSDPSQPSQPTVDPTTPLSLAKDVLKIGDIVSYKAYRSVTCEQQSDRITQGTNTWQVFKVTGNAVELITTSIPECYKFERSTKASGAVSALNTRAKAYLDSNYASGARAMNLNDALTYGGKEDLTAGKKRNTGVYYWLATAGSSASQIYGVRNAGAASKTGFVFEGSYHNYGIRPIVTLKSNIYAKKNSSGIWVLSTTNKGDMPTDNSLYERIEDLINSTIKAEVGIE